MTTSYNTDKPTPGRHPLWLTIEAGWEYVIEGDELVLQADEDGNPIPCVWKFPARLTAQEIRSAVAAIGNERLQELAELSGLDVAVEIVGGIVGAEMVTSLASNKYVTGEQFMAIILDVVSAWGMGEVVPASDTPNPTPPPLAG